MSYDGVDYAVQLATPLIVRQTSTVMPPSLVFEQNSDFQGFAVSGYQTVPGTGKPVSITLPSSTQEIIKARNAYGEATVTGSSSTSSVVYTVTADNLAELEKEDAESGAKQTNRQTLNKYSRTVLTEQLSTETQTYDDTYVLDGWTIYEKTFKDGVGTWKTNGTFYKAGATFTGNGVYKAVPHFKVVKSKLTGATVVTQERVTTTDVSAGTATRTRTRSAVSSGCSGYKWGNWGAWSLSCEVVETAYLTPNIVVRDK